MRDMLCDTELDVCEAADFTTVFQNLDQVRLLAMVLYGIYEMLQRMDSISS